MGQPKPEAQLNLIGAASAVILSSDRLPMLIATSVGGHGEDACHSEERKC